MNTLEGVGHINVRFWYRLLLVKSQYGTNNRFTWGSFETEVEGLATQRGEEGVSEPLSAERTTRRRGADRQDDRSTCSDSSFHLSLALASFSWRQGG